MDADLFLKMSWKQSNQTEQIWKKLKAKILGKILILKEIETLSNFIRDLF